MQNTESKSGDITSPSQIPEIKEKRDSEKMGGNPGHNSNYTQSLTVPHITSPNAGKKDSQRSTASKYNAPISHAYNYKKGGSGGKHPNIKRITSPSNSERVPDSSPVDTGTPQSREEDVNRREHSLSSSNSLDSQEMEERRHNMMRFKVSASEMDMSERKRRKKDTFVSMSDVDVGGYDVGGMGMGSGRETVKYHENGHGGARVRFQSDTVESS